MKLEIPDEDLEPHNKGLGALLRLHRGEEGGGRSVLGSW
jgi:hypothetical protein